MSEHVAGTGDVARGRTRIEPPDPSEKGGLKAGVPQRSDERLFIQLLAFGGCTDSAAAAHHLQQGGIDGALYEDVNDPRGIAVVTLTSAPEEFVTRVRPLMTTVTFTLLTS